MIEKKPTRDGYGEALLELIEKNDRVIVMDADVAKSTRTNWVQEKNPEKFLDMGISEQDMIGTAAGMALAGMIPFVTTYGVFLSGRGWDQIRTTVCYTNLNVKFGGAHGGISVGPDGATHQALEEVAIMRVLPHMTVVVPCDAIETRKATLAVAAMEGPAYLRFGREAVPIVTDESTPFQLGKGAMFRDGDDITVIANGPMVYEALAAAEILADEGISVRVINLHTVKPLDEEIIIKAAKETGAIVTAEEHQIYAGMGSAVAECIVKNYPVPIEMVGINDTFGESGEPKELAVKYGVTSNDVINAIRKVLKRK
ncbi:transketolase family protein [Petroclostridium sp. X23]|uniref:transketolase family protein n=1 Tax=Petroclostridium sp. X23 TaxID=3045146 RepID=UPI0024ACBFC8|nr:transketolase family protein [Petroclostridium sp. X23]WHH59202.1 transketolase family protein [Petroclostridium sp. X23]